ncbi:MAG TPA: hypothetical protein VMD48_09680 [Solirubrobacteraceae bacterium]|nr:hypothetical protein [Solirubrobacteraceae bacterium]
MTSVQSGFARSGSDSGSGSGLGSGPAAGAAPALDGVLALVGGSGEPDGSLLARDVQTWVASPEQGLRASIDALRGADASAAALTDLSPSDLTLVGAAVSDRACWAEVVRGVDGETETCLVGLSYDAAGAVSRLVWLRAPFVPASSEVGEESAGPDGRSVLERYLSDLQSSAFREAASHFTVDTIYSHPPYGGGTERALFQGREALWRGFATERGPSPVRQIVTGFWQRDARVFVEGVIEGIPDGGTFFSTGQITPDGEIARYVAFYSATRIPS